MGGCSGEGDRPSGPSNIGGEGGEGPVRGPTTTDTGNCSEDGKQQDCLVNIQLSNGLKSCFRGIQFCVDSDWTECLPPGTENPATQ